MIDLSPSELKARMNGLTGPWSARGRYAARQIAKGLGVKSKIAKDEIINLRRIGQDRKSKALDARLQKVLRPHWVEAVVMKREMEFRDSLDDALTYFKLVEMAVETGYLPTHQVPQYVRQRMAKLLWSRSVRDYVEAYEYEAVDFLAGRLGILGTKGRMPPKIDERAEVRFSGFIATLHQIESDKLINAWLAFLDDYEREKNEKDVFFEFLDGDGDEPSRRFIRLLVGAHRFSVTLADFFTMTPDFARGQFAQFYAYWLSRHLGYEYTKRGYRKDAANWPNQHSWSNALKRYFKRRVKAGLAGGLDRAQLDIFVESASTLSQVWSDARRYSSAVNLEFSNHGTAQALARA